MRALIAWALRRRAAVALLALLAAAVALGRVDTLPLDVFPEFVAPQISVQTEVPGGSPAQVEARVTTPLERALAGAPGVRAMRSESIAGLSVISLDLADDSDPQTARQGVAERLASAQSALPAGTAAPQLSPLTSSTMDVLKFGLTSDRLDPDALRAIAVARLRPALLAVPGVARVTVFGGRLPQWQLELDPLRLQAAGLGLRELVDGASGALQARGTGLLQTARQQLPLNLAEPAGGVAAWLGETVLADGAEGPLRIADVATLRRGFAPAVGDTLINGGPGVLLTLSGQYGSNTLALTRQIEARLEALRGPLAAEGIQLVTPLHRPASFVERALRGLAESLAIGAALVLVLLLLFLRDARSAFIAFVTLPLSLLAAAEALHGFGQSLNTLTLGGLAVALGVLVDDAVIDIENVLRRLRANAAAATPEPRLAVILAASLEVRMPVLLATVVLLLAFLPVLGLDGVQGRLLAPMALAFVLAVLASLLVAILLTPALCGLLLGHAGDAGEPHWWRRLEAWHGRAMRAARARLPLLGGGLLLALLLAALGSGRRPGEFFPTFREGHFVLQVSIREPSAALAETRRVGRAISAELRALPWVAAVEQQIGRAELGEDTWGPYRSEFHVELKADAEIDQAAAQRQLRRLLAGYPGLQVEVMTFLGDRISETLTGDTAQVVVNASGADLDALAQVASALERRAARLPGVVDLRRNTAPASAQLEVAFDAAALARLGVRRGDAQDLLAAAAGGRVLGQVYEDGLPVDVALTLAGVPATPEALAALIVPALRGEPVALARVASLRSVEAAASLRHEGGQRLAGIAFNVEGRSAAAVVDDLRRSLRSLALPAGVVLDIRGVAAAEAAAHRQLLELGLLALLAIAACLLLAFQRRRHAALVLLNLPFALVGSLLAVALVGLPLSLGVLVGLVTVFGISARNAILLLAHGEQLAREGLPWGAALAWRAARERLRPVLMTALLTALGMVPLALGLGRPGHEIEGPLAVTVLGGLASSTLLTLILLPAIMAWLDRGGVDIRNRSAPAG